MFRRRFKGMPNCPECKKEIEVGAATCSHCGKQFRGDELEDIETKTSTWQKIVIAVGLIALIAIGFTFMGAENRENKAAMNDFSKPLAELISGISDESKLGREFGTPSHTLKADTKTAEVTIEFPRGTLSPMQAEVFAKSVCVGLTRTYVSKGYMPRAITVRISSAAPGGKKRVYGQAFYNGDLDTMAWEPDIK